MTELGSKWEKYGLLYKQKHIIRNEHLMSMTYCCSVSRLQNGTASVIHAWCCLVHQGGLG